jgi:hypothetical protein
MLEAAHRADWEVSDYGQKEIVSGAKRSNLGQVEYVRVISI